MTHYILHLDTRSPWSDKPFAGYVFDVIRGYLKPEWDDANVDMDTMQIDLMRGGIMRKEVNASGAGRISVRQIGDFIYNIKGLPEGTDFLDLRMKSKGILESLFVRKAKV